MRDRLRVERKQTTQCIYKFNQMDAIRSVSFSKHIHPRKHKNRDTELTSEKPNCFQVTYQNH